MRKKSCLVLITVISLLMFTSCGNEPDNTNSSESSNGEDTKIFTLNEVEPWDFVRDDEGKKDYRIDVFDANLPSTEYSIGSIASFGTNYYYAQTTDIPMGESMKTCDIIEYNLETKERNILYQIESESFWLNELKASENYLFWIMKQDKEVRIEQYNKESKDISTVKVLSQSEGVSLETDGNYLSWYEYEGQTVSLYVYDIKADEIRLVSNKIAKQSPHTRGYINDGIVVFVTENNSYQTLNVYNLKEDKLVKKIDLSPDFRASHCQGNNDFVIWSQGDYEDSNFPIYAYNLKENVIAGINTVEDSKSVFSFNLAGNLLFINDSINNSIFCRDLDTKQETVLLEKEKGDFAFYLARTVMNQNYIAIDGIDNQLIYIEKVVHN